MIECIHFKPYKKGNLVGFANLYIDKWQVEIHGCPLYVKDGQRWINLPANEYQNSEGEKKFMPYIRFREKKHFAIFCTEAKKAIDEWCTKEKVCLND